MKQGTAFTLLACLLLAACNVPTGTKPTASPDAEKVATEVSLLLTAQPTPTRPAATTAPTDTSLPPTPPATVTPAPATAEPAATATISPEDPRSALGDPTWKNPFDNGRAFGLETPYEDDNARIAVEGGKMTLKALQNNGWHSWRLTAPKLLDFYLEAQVHTAACSGSDLYGLIVRAPDYESGKGYWFGVTCDGRYSFSEWVESGLSSVVKLTPNEAIHAGANQDNRLGIKVQGKQISLYANGKLLQKLSDDTFPEAGLFGAWIAPFETSGFTVEIDELDYWKIE